MECPRTKHYVSLTDQAMQGLREIVLLNRAWSLIVRPQAVAARLSR